MITVIDSMPGTGKTSWAIQEMMNNPEQKYIYITPFLDEVERVKEQCDRYFYEPNEKLGKGSKYTHFLELLKEGKNIVSTHALFRNVTREITETIEKYNYVLILDEVLNVIEKNVINKDDLEILKKMNIVEVKNNQLFWLDENYNGKLAEYKNSILNGDMFVVDDSVILWTFPVSVFKSFKHIYILTFMFEGQLQAYYYNMYNVEYEYKSVGLKEIKGKGDFERKIYELIDYIEPDLTEIKQLINIYKGKYNRIGNKHGKENPFSITWFKRQEENKTDALDILNSNIENYFKNACKEELSNGKKKAYKSEFNIWTMPKEIALNDKGKVKFKIKGNTKNFVSWNIRATNKYRCRVNIAYCINLFVHVIDKKFFNSMGVKINEDQWALSEMIQFIFRSRIRDNKSINIYIPSERMRNLLTEWLEK